MATCFNPTTFQYDNSECKSKSEACARWSGVRKNVITGCIRSEYCGTSALYKGDKTNFKCPNGIEKQGIANSSSVIPPELYADKDL